MTVLKAGSILIININLILLIKLFDQNLFKLQFFKRFNFFILTSHVFNSIQILAYFNLSFGKTFNFVLGT